MYRKGSIINNRYEVIDLYSDEGGMGTIVTVSDMSGEHNGALALKYCKQIDEELIKRFQREVRLLAGFAGNTKIIQLLDSELTHDPPYFVMRLYPDGDLTTLTTEIQQNKEFQEGVFNKMIDCISELHRSRTLHRDIKPENFLRDGNSIVVSDLGLSIEADSKTAFTRSSQRWGTPGYIPPEFLEHGGFKNATEESDVYMLGKSFYRLLTGRDPQFINSSSIDKPLFYLIEKCCQQKKEARYRTTSDLKQALKSVYDVLLRRTNYVGTADQRLDQIIDLLQRENKYNIKEVTDLIDSVVAMDSDDAWLMVSKFPQSLFLVLSQQGLEDALEKFLPVYRDLVLTAAVHFAYAETVAREMRTVFNNAKDDRSKVEALKIAIEMAIRMNRFAAMDTCIEMIHGIADDNLAVLVREVVVDHRDNFISSIQPINCKNGIIRAAIKSIK